MISPTKIVYDKNPKIIGGKPHILQECNICMCGHELKHGYFTLRALNDFLEENTKKVDVCRLCLVAYSILKMHQ